jgi:hypothetical protein
VGAGEPTNQPTTGPVSAGIAQTNKVPVYGSFLKTHPHRWVFTMNTPPSVGGLGFQKEKKLAICGAIAAPESKGPIMHK